MGLVARRGDDDEDDDVQIQLSGDLWLDGLENLDGRDDVVQFDLADWPEATRARLRERLDLLMVVSHWNDDTTLVVTEPLDPVYLERVLNQVRDEAERGVALPADRGGVAEETTTEVTTPDEIGYDLEGWDEVNRSVLFAALDAEGIRFRVTVPGADGDDGDELIVVEADEARVDELIDEIVEPGGDERGDVPPELLGELFVLADRLAHDPLDHDARRSLAAKAEQATSSRPPFGVERAWWRAVTEQSAGLVEMMGTAGVDHDAVVADATELRDALRPYV